MLTLLHPHFSHLEDTIAQTEIVRFEKFSDGWPRIFLEDKEKIQGKEIAYIGDFRYVDDFFGQLAFLDGVIRYGPDRLHIYVPFFPAASMERDTPSGELSIANVFARTLGLIGERKPWNVFIHLYDIHDEREVFYFPPSLQIRHHTTTDILKKVVFESPLSKEGTEWNEVGDLPHSQASREQNPQSLRASSFKKEPTKPIILFPDAGAKKAFSRFFTDYEIVTCAKVRKSPTEIDMYFEWGNLEGREVLIVDDHIRTWGTLIEAARYAREKWAKSVSTFAPHAVFAEWVKPAFIEAFDYIYTTDTIPENISRFAGNEKVKVLPFFS